MRLFKKEKKKERCVGIKQLESATAQGTKTGLKTSMKFSQTSWQRAEKLRKV